MLHALLRPLPLAFSTLVIGCGRLGFEPSAPPLEVPTAQRGATSFASSDLSIDIVPVSTEHSILIFGVAVSDAQSSCAHVTGSLESSRSILLTRHNSTCASTVDVSWNVVDFGRGARVQRGTVFATNDHDNIAVALEPVNPPTSLALLSAALAGDNFDTDDFVRYSITGPTTLTIMVGGGRIEGRVDWQVVDLGSHASVERGDVVLPVNGLATFAGLASPFLPDSSFALVSTSHDTFDAPYIGPLTVAASLESPDRLHLFRLVGGHPLTIGWQVVTLHNGFRVQTGVASLSSDATFTDVAIRAVRLERAVAFSTTSQRGGAVDYASTSDATDDIGGAWFTAEVVSQTTLRLTRAVALGSASVPWVVLELPDPAN